MTTCRLVPATLPTASNLAHVRTAVVPWRFAVVRAATDGSVVGTDYFREVSFNHFSTTSVLLQYYRVARRTPGRHASHDTSFSERVARRRTPRASHKYMWLRGCVRPHLALACSPSCPPVCFVLTSCLLPARAAALSDVSFLCEKSLLRQATRTRRPCRCPAR